MPVRLIGANPGLRLYAAEADDQPVAYASAWRVDWSPHGSGNALVVWRAGAVRVVAPSRELGEWLATGFNRHFPEVRALPWTPPEVTVAPVRYESDLARGIRAEGADLALEIGDPLDRRLVRVDDFDLGGSSYLLSTVLMPCRRGALWVGGAPVPGAPRVTTTPPVSSTAFLADAEVWCEPPNPPDAPAR